MTQYIKLITKAVQKYANVSKPIKTAHSILGWYELFSEFCDLKTRTTKPSLNVKLNHEPYISYQSFKKSSRHRGYQMYIHRDIFSEVAECQLTIL